MIAAVVSEVRARPDKDKISATTWEKIQILLKSFETDTLANPGFGSNFGVFFAEDRQEAAENIAAFLHRRIPIMWESIPPECFEFRFKDFKVDEFKQVHFYVHGETGWLKIPPKT